MPQLPPLGTARAAYFSLMDLLFSIASQNEDEALQNLAEVFAAAEANDVSRSIIAFCCSSLGAMMQRAADAADAENITTAKAAAAKAAAATATPDPFADVDFGDFNLRTE